MIKKIAALTFVKEIENEGGKVYLVGGCVRDFFLNKKANDIDLLTTKINMDDLIIILERYGKVDVVGKSFGVIKFKCVENSETYEIALPRIEKQIKPGHSGIEVVYDKDISLEVDLKRRDLTINSMAIDLKGILTDPYGGYKDLKNKIICRTNEQSFKEDSIRIFRALRFGISLNFKYEKQTLLEMQKFFFEKQASYTRISIDGERTYSEIYKIFSYPINLVIKHSIRTNFLEACKEIKVKGIRECLKSLSEKLLVLFEYALRKENVKLKPEENYFIFEKLKIFNNIYYLNFTSTPFDYVYYHNIGTIYYAMIYEHKSTELCLRNSYSIAKNRIKNNDINTSFLNTLAKTALPHVPKSNITTFYEIAQNKYPCNVKQLDIDGNDLLKIGLVGAQIASAQTTLLQLVLSDTIVNQKSKLSKAALAIKLRYENQTDMDIIRLSSGS